ncbi:MAG: alanine--tRNA ligase [Gammaproteobacteria bacterium]
METAQVRNKFIQYFESKDHQAVPSSSLVPANDPSLLFTNAGMVQFKDVFLGLDKRDFVRATSSQRCVRAGGKHNDLDNVGYTARHHTFFEMLGNFSFGDYFKREAIEFAWELLLDGFGLPADKLWVTVFENDDEAADIWRKHIGIPDERISRCGEKDNFWMMGDTGPCGPCSEIFFDHGPGVAGGPPGSPDEDGDRYIEIWNLVFMQYERLAGGEQKSIPRPSVDTGMGLERIAAVLQGVHNNYDIDLFQHLIAGICDLAGTKDLEITSLRVVADHIRSCAFLITDGVLPSNEGRGYVLRRIIRRALRHGNKLGFDQPFFHRLVETLANEMGAAFPELSQAQKSVASALKNEEIRFAETLDQGLKIFEQAVSELSGKTIPGEVAFKLNDTYGFPVDLTADIARERGLTIDMPGYEAAMQAQREQSRAASSFSGVDTSDAIPLDALNKMGSEQAFSGYETLKTDTKVLGIFANSEAVDSVSSGQAASLVLEKTPFYAESGGQVGDIGRLTSASGRFVVHDTQKRAGLFIHQGEVEQGTISTREEISAEVESAVRQRTRLNHSATHLLHAALRNVLGEHIAQKGSLVDADKLRFDFSHDQALSDQELLHIEEQVNDQIRANHLVKVHNMAFKDAQTYGAVALFGEKYGDEVRVLDMGGYSIELCGGTHVNRTGDIGLFKIVSESGVAAGVRRIEAITGQRALGWIHEMNNTLNLAASALKTSPDKILAKLQQLNEKAKASEKEIRKLKDQLAGSSGAELGSSAVKIGEVMVVAEIIDGADVETLRNAVDKLKDKLKNAAVVLAAVEDGKVRIIAGVTKTLSKELKAGDLVNYVANQVGGKGGGRPDMAQAGGDQPDNLPTALASVADWVTAKVE